MGVNDTLEQLNAARAYAVDLEAENAELRARLADAEVTLTELQPADVLVEGSWFPVRELPTILGNFMRSSDECGRDVKQLHLDLEEARGRLAGVDVLDVELLRQEKAALAATIERVKALEPTWHRGMYGSPDDMFSRIAITRAIEGGER